MLWTFLNFLINKWGKMEFLIGNTKGFFWKKYICIFFGKTPMESHYNSEGFLYRFMPPEFCFFLLNFWEKTMKKKGNTYQG